MLVGLGHVFSQPSFQTKGKQDDAATQECRIPVTPSVPMDQSRGAGWAQHLEVGASSDRVEMLGAGRAARGSVEQTKDLVQGNTQQAGSDQQAFHSAVGCL